MLTRLGARPTEGDLVDLLLDCHQRIRTFTDLAARLAAAERPSAEEVRDAAARVHRYFSEALPLHARDEEESILPRLEGREPEVDRALSRMRAEHAVHGEPVGAVLALCAALRDDPARHAELAPALGAAAGELRRHFDGHLELEERVIFPAVRRLLDPDAEERARGELRARRAPDATR
ncbi:MAG TPA: hemerythrin domain-containing protein [Anaeromyxobacteraceae bacterium]|jgi:hemerythrin-like domain-containing protein|nr:hemerythrin domain-containing protein [Anaeromyxobacteraceae bacterium]